MTDQEEQEKDLLRKEVSEEDPITEELLIEIYEIERELSVKDRRIGISNRLQKTIENFANQ